LCKTFNELGKNHPLLGEERQNVLPAEKTKITELQRDPPFLLVKSALPVLRPPWPGHPAQSHMFMYIQCRIPFDFVSVAFFINSNVGLQQNAFPHFVFLCFFTIYLNSKPC
jgi:hypothetical protein